MEEAIGSGFSVRALEDGVVSKVTGTKVVVKTKDGQVEHELYKDLPLNSKSFLNAEVRVKVGDEVKAGQVVADFGLQRLV